MLRQPSDIDDLTTPMLAQTFCRKFQWHELMLWPEDMPPHALVCLSHNDDLVPSAMVAKHIAGVQNSHMQPQPCLTGPCAWC
jgi:hypothetical protein